MGYGGVPLGGPIKQSLVYGNGGTEGATIPTGPQANRMSAIHEQLSALDGHTEKLHGVIAELEQRLCCVLSPVLPVSQAGTEKPGHPVPLAAGLSELNGRVAYAVQRVHDLLGRLEV